MLLQRRERPRSARGRHRRRYAATHDRSGIWLSGVQPPLWTVRAHDQADYGRNTKWSNEKAADARKMMCLRSGGRLAGFAGGPRSFYRFRAFHRSVLIMRVSKVMITALVAASAGNAFAADADNGQRIARRWCAECHVVGPKQRQGSADVPSFAAIAARPGFNVRGLAFFLLDPHPKMPNLFLTRTEAQDIAAYIAGLR